MKKTLIILLVFLCCASVQAQKVLLSQDVLQDTVVPKKGPNRKSFSHLYVGYGLIFGDEGNLKTKQPGTSDFRIGYRLKRKVSESFSFGGEVSYIKNSFRPKNNPAGIEKVKFIVNRAEAGLYLRLNYGKRGDKIGNFIDIGGSGGWIFKSALIQTDKKPVSTFINANTLQTKYTGLSFIEDLSYSGLIRIGFGRYVFYGEYRISDVIAPAYSRDDLPRITAGIQIGLH